MACSFQGSLLNLPTHTVPKFLHSSSINADMSNNSKSKNKTDRKSSAIRSSIFCTGDLRPQLDEYPEGIISGEWPDNFSLLSYTDLRAYFESQAKKAQPSPLLGDVMTSPVRTVTRDQTLEEINHHLEFVSGLPVLDSEFRCIGIISKTDREKASQGLKTKVSEVMSSPAICLPPEKTVVDAAVLMLKNEIHRIPIVNNENQLIGIVTRSDIFKALEDLERMSYKWIEHPF